MRFWVLGYAWLLSRVIAGIVCQFAMVLLTLPIHTARQKHIERETEHAHSRRENTGKRHLHSTPPAWHSKLRTQDPPFLVRAAMAKPSEDGQQKNDPSKGEGRVGIGALLPGHSMHQAEMAERCLCQTNKQRSFRISEHA